MTSTPSGHRFAERRNTTSHVCLGSDRIVATPVFTPWFPDSCVIQSGNIASYKCLCFQMYTTSENMAPHPLMYSLWAGILVVPSTGCSKALLGLQVLGGIVCVPMFWCLFPHLFFYKVISLVWCNIMWDPRLVSQIFGKLETVSPAEA